MSDLVPTLLTLGGVVIGAAVSQIGPTAGAISKSRARKQNARQHARDRKEARWRELYGAFTDNLRAAADAAGSDRRALSSLGTAQAANPRVLKLQLDSVRAKAARVQVDGSPEALLIATGVLAGTRDVQQMLMLGQAFDKTVLDRLYDVLTEAETAMIKLSRTDFGADAS
jgi:hypothetical protein